MARVDAAGMGALYREVELPAEAAAGAMRRNGVGVDIVWLQKLDFELGRQQASTRERIWAAAGRRLNPESDADVAAAAQGLAGRGGPGVAAGRSPDRDGFAALVEDFRDLRRTGSTAANLLRHVDPWTGRIYCDLDPLGAETGRFTCADPPLQSLPRVLRGLVVAGPGNLLVAADFSQVELRVLAHLSQDPGLLGALRRGVDLHRRTAAYALGVPEAAVTEAQRRGVGKAVNFGVVYGQTAHGLAGTLSIDVERAVGMLANYFARHPGVHQWIVETRRAALRDGSVVTLFDRRRGLPGLRSGDPFTRDRALRQAVNTVVQGTAAELNKLALARLHRGLGPDCRLVFTVHDSVLVEAPSGRAAEVAGQVRQLMQVLPSRFTLPLPVVVGVGPNCEECERGAV